MLKFKITTGIFCWLRFKNQYEMIATECGSNNADILAVKKDKVMEIEIKTSISDFKADFRNKDKHSYYSNADTYVENEMKKVMEEPQVKSMPEGETKQNTLKRYKQKFQRHLKGIPNKYYFAVPEQLAEKVKAELELKGYDKYGILTWSEERPHIVITYKRATELKKEPVSDGLKKRITARMGSMIANSMMLQASIETIKYDIKRYTDELVKEPNELEE
jgi:hypothetical protein